VTASTPATDYACALALAVARNLAGIAAGILQQWQGPDGYRAVVLSAAEGNDVYYDAEEMAGDFIQSIHTALDVAIAVKLEQAIGISPAKARPKRLESWRSERSLANMRANLETARALYTTDGAFSDLLVARAGGAALDQATRERFAGLLGLLDSIQGPLVVAIVQPSERPKVEQLLVDLKALRKSLRLEIAPALGLVIGFNATDGD
jgi:predicted lipoprotein